MKLLRFAPLFVCLAVGTAPRSEADLKPHTLEAFLKYARATEVEFLEQVGSAQFLRLERLDADQRATAEEETAAGRIYAQQLESRGENGEKIEIKNGLIHHWYAVAFVPATKLDVVLDVVKDYATHAELFNPDVQESGIIRVNEKRDEFDIHYVFQKKKVITVVYDTDHHVVYTPVSDIRAYSISKTTRVQEFEDYGKASQDRKAPDEGRGFLYRINSYWRFEERPDGTYIECESITLTRDIPLLLRPFVSPFVKDLPEETLAATLQNLRNYLIGGAPPEPYQHPLP